MSSLRLTFTFMAIWVLVQDTKPTSTETIQCFSRCAQNPFFLLLNFRSICECVSMIHRSSFVYGTFDWFVDCFVFFGKCKNGSIAHHEEAQVKCAAKRSVAGRQRARAKENNFSLAVNYICAEQFSAIETCDDRIGKWFTTKDTIEFVWLHALIHAPIITIIISNTQNKPWKLLRQWE